jgi:hypothetical protein
LSGLTIGATVLGVLFSALQILFKKINRWWLLKKADKAPITSGSKFELPISMQNENDNKIMKSVREESEKILENTISVQ